MAREETTPTFWSAPELAKAGYPVFPIAPGEKKPSLEGGFYGASRDLSEIAKWIEEGRGEHNIAVPTGIAYDSCIVVIEADSEEACAWMEEHYGPPTVESAHKHKSGAHWYFKHPRNGKVSSRKVENVPADLDRKGDGGYVLAPPSTGKRWAADMPEKEDVPLLPPELRGTSRRSVEAVNEQPVRGNGRLTEEARVHAAEVIASHVRTIEPGKRHEHLMHLCGVLLNRHISPDDARTILVSAWTQSGDDDLAERAYDEITNTLATTQEAIARRSATGVPQMEEITPGLFRELEEILRWRLGVTSPNGNSGYCGHSGHSVQSKNGVGYAEEWTPPAAFHAFELAPFPEGTFPEWLEAYVSAVAQATQTPRDLAGMLALTIGAAVSAKVVSVEVWDGWIEPTNLYTATVLRPGTRKSEVFKRMCAPLREVEKQLTEQSAPKVAESQSRYSVYEQRLKKAESQASKAQEPSVFEDLTAEAAEVARELALMKVLSAPQLLADDVTPERLAAILAEQGGRVAVMSDEGGIFDMLAGRYSQGVPNLDTYLKGHAGIDLRIDRVGRPADVVPEPAITTGLAVQPDVLRGLASRPGFRGRGLLGRFLYSIPPDTLGSRGSRLPAVESEVRQRYHRKVRYLAKLVPLPFEVGHEAHILTLEAAAQDAMEAFSDWIEPQLADGGDLGDMTDWAGKLAGAVGRIAAVLHTFEHAGEMEPWRHKVTEDVVKRAIEVGRYLIGHARYAMASMGSDSRIEDARYILRRIERTGSERLTKREIWRATRGRFDTVSDLEGGLDVLIAHGYMREDPTQPPHRGPGRKPSPLYEINPLRAEVGEEK